MLQPGRAENGTAWNTTLGGSVAGAALRDPTGGAGPRTVPQDRTENVTLTEPGKYLVICAVQPHFVADNMHGYITVQGGDK